MQKLHNTFTSSKHKKKFHYFPNKYDKSDIHNPKQFPRGKILQKQ